MMKHWMRWVRLIPWIFLNQMGELGRELCNSRGSRREGDCGQEVLNTWGATQQKGRRDCMFNL